MKNDISIEEINRRKFLGLTNPFQSWAQFGSFLAVTGAVLMVIYILTLLFAPGTFSYIIIISALIGAMPTLYITLPSKMTIQCSSDNYLIWHSNVVKWLVFFGYTERKKIQEKEIFKTKQKKILRWSENELTVSKQAEMNKLSIVVVGPSLILKKLQTQLTKN